MITFLISWYPILTESEYDYAEYDDDYAYTDGAYDGDYYYDEEYKNGKKCSLSIYLGSCRFILLSNSSLNKCF